MTHRLATNYAKNYCNRTLIVKVIVENVVTCFLGHSVYAEVFLRKLFVFYLAIRLQLQRTHLLTYLSYLYIT